MSTIEVKIWSKWDYEMLWSDNPNWVGESVSISDAAEAAAEEYAKANPCRIGIFSGASIQQKIVRPIDGGFKSLTYWVAKPRTSFSVAQILEPEDASD